MKDMMKRLLSITLALVLLLSCADFSVLTRALAEGTAGDTNVGAAPDELESLGE